MSYFSRIIAACATAAMFVLCVPLVSSQPAFALFKQQKKLIGSLPAGASVQGQSVALSADGNTAIVGGDGDNSNIGAVWVFTRSNGVWKQQGHKLVGTGAAGPMVFQGISVALSADGNTALVGGSADNSGTGAVWVFTRKNAVWSQQGQKLVGTNPVGAAFQGASVALSADGNTAIVGGNQDNSFKGAVWVFTRSNGVWSQQGQKLVGTGVMGNSTQGSSVALSADGNIAIVGGFEDNSFAGAAWVFTRSNGVWKQQGQKLVGTGAVGAAIQGTTVALSANGATAIVGGYQDNGNAGAAWVFTRAGTVWKQQGQKLVGSGATGAAKQGTAVSLSGDGNTALIGGVQDNTNAGAAWIFTRTGTVWKQQGVKLIGTGAIGAAHQDTSVALSGDGNTAIVGGIFDNSNVGAAWVFVEAPTVTAVSPKTGHATGGTIVTITGTNFTGATAVKFGTTAATSFVVKNATTITAHAPKHAAGVVTVTVTTSAGTGSEAKAFTFQ